MREKCSRALRNSPCRQLATIVAALIVLAIASSDVAAQSLTLEYQQVATRPVPGATAAMSLDPSRVTASVQDGVVTLIGRGPGSTNVIVIAGDETVTLRVLVGEPPVVLLPGMRGAGAQNGSTGYYEGRYGSDPGIFQGVLFVSRRDGDRTAELMLGGAAPFGNDIGSPFSIPQATFSLRSPRREITLLDRVIENSPLTISRSNVRGLYLREGAWQINAGYSFFSTFEHLLLPTDREAVAGLAYRHRLSSRSTLTPNLFYFDGTPQSGHRGALGTLLYETQPASDVKVLAELGVGRSVGGALGIELDRPNNRAWAKARFAPPGLPSLTVDQQSGEQVEGGWIWQGDAVGRQRDGVLAPLRAGPDRSDEQGREPRPAAPADRALGRSRRFGRVDLRERRAGHAWNQEPDAAARHLVLRTQRRRRLRLSVLPGNDAGSRRPSGPRQSQRVRARFPVVRICRAPDPGADGPADLHGDPVAAADARSPRARREHAAAAGRAAADQRRTGRLRLREQRPDRRDADSHPPGRERGLVRLGWPSSAALREHALQPRRIDRAHVARPPCTR